MIYHCCDDRRRNAVKDHPTLNGIDFLEVVDNPADAVAVRQTVLTVHLIKEIAVDDLPDPPGVPKLAARIEGGERIGHIVVVTVKPNVPPAVAKSPAPTKTRVLTVTVKQAGDFSTYTLRLTGFNTTAPPAGFDPVLSAIDFSFKVNCPTEFDCLPAPCPPEAPAILPTINYLAKDYASFRQLLLDRLALLVPDWTERNPADLGMTLVELLAYVGDYLSYQQDATATEAYLHTARKRTSVRRHTRLVDYLMHDGSNARAWVQIRVEAGPSLNLLHDGPEGKVQFLTTVPALSGQAALGIGSPDYQTALRSGAQVFELLHDATLIEPHNELQFYTWGDANCCLPVGATSATLIGNFANLKGKVLVLAEVRGPNTGLPQDADPTHRQAVRVISATPTNDLLGDPAIPPGKSTNGFEFLVTTIEWHPADALTFPLCISSKSGTNRFTDVSKAFGNIVLADQGRTMQAQPGDASALLPNQVPASTLNRPPRHTDHCDDTPLVPILPRYRPLLQAGPLTQAALYEHDLTASASAAMRWSLREPLPAIRLTDTTTGDWHPQRDLLDSHGTDRVFVVEVETDGIAWLRFGNDQQGARPKADTTFGVTYRIGNGIVGNIGAEKLTHIAAKNQPPGILSVTNWIPAQGGTAPETMEEARQKAPTAFRRQERAVTPADYEIMSRFVDDSIQRTACTFRWTGSWRTAFVTADRLDNRPVDANFETRLRAGLERYRMAGYDLEVNGPQFVSLEIRLIVCVEPGYFASAVKAALLAVFTRQRLADGRPGLFHPDQFTFGQTVWLSPLYAAAQAVAGVSSVQITMFKRQGSFDTKALTAGRIELGRLEIARCDNDPNFPERGLFTLTMYGGR